MSKEEIISTFKVFRETLDIPIQGEPVYTWFWIPIALFFILVIIGIIYGIHEFLDFDDWIGAVVAGVFIGLIAGLFSYAIYQGTNKPVELTEASKQAEIAKWVSEHIVNDYIPALPLLRLQIKEYHFSSKGITVELSDTSNQSGEGIVSLKEDTDVKYIDIDEAYIEAKWVTGLPAKMGVDDGFYAATLYLPQNTQKISSR
ncbi:MULTISPECIES: hypothetical protein [Paenibacillus]|uniref:Uncharacterized protein n=1 Tax=Paenibacillus vandeheii TaxID=3035917 RepID=A0ABT8JFG7_9BACL|nr:MULTISPECIES: hypothetical protein [Paenibacillus]KGP81933.1 hypothetical protein P364_0113990 [Paenibacillus sp. MAEPY2]KGP87365.1 hypothetical protein P363_0112490 [Paenibacillus sp. MAEPY1]MDN4603846.1 hypothetical protein [Paenibacillus vandeheii]